MSIEAMKQALDKACEAMELAGKRIDELKAENASLRQAIAGAEKQEPVAWMHPRTKDVFGTYSFAKTGCGVDEEPLPLYTSINQHQESKIDVFYERINKASPKLLLLMEEFFDAGVLCGSGVLSHTSPPQRQWVGLTDEHPLMVFAKECVLGAYQESELADAAQRAIKAAHGIKGEV